MIHSHHAVVHLELYNVIIFAHLLDSNFFTTCSWAEVDLQTRNFTMVLALANVAMHLHYIHGPSALMSSSHTHTHTSHSTVCKPMLVILVYQLIPTCTQGHSILVCMFKKYIYLCIWISTLGLLWRGENKSPVHITPGSYVQEPGSGSETSTGFLIIFCMLHYEPIMLLFFFVQDAFHRPHFVLTMEAFTIHV